jgi:methyl-accepting chemotaxis protein
MLSAGYQQYLSSAYLVMAITFVLGMFSIYTAMKGKRERIVFRERREEENDLNTQNQGSGQQTISLNSIKSTLNSKSTELTSSFIKTMCNELEAGQGALYTTIEIDGVKKMKLTAGYALTLNKDNSLEFEIGEGLVGQSALEKKALYIDDIPEGYIKVVSGLGNSSPQYLLVTPVVHQEEVLGVTEMAFFKKLSEDEKKFCEEANALLAEKLVSNNAIKR